MSNCNFTISYPESASALVQKAKQAILNVNNAAFEGDTTTGSFSLPTPLGQVKGTYVILGQDATFNIHEKPFMLSCKLIEGKLRGYLEENNEKSKDVE